MSVSRISSFPVYLHINQSSQWIFRLILFCIVTGGMKPEWKSGLITCQCQTLFPDNQMDGENLVQDGKYVRVKGGKSRFSRENNPSVSPPPIVTLKQGSYIGEIKRSRNDREYYSFIGIRYAKPVERFQQWAELPEESKSIFNATSYGPVCLQNDWFKNKLLGDEDCLFINVYVPKLENGIEDEGRRFPTMVYSSWSIETPVQAGLTRAPRFLTRVLILFGKSVSSNCKERVYIHGGAFLFGSGNIYLPDYFMDEDVILITLNYRLGVLGFLATQDSTISGNMGLKDQVVALKWLQENIRQFSGDPNLITIFGESAGGASVSYHLISPTAQGLFKNGISHSGTSLCPWAFVRRPKRVAVKLGRLLNCSTTISKEFLDCLKTKDPKDIVSTQEKLTTWNKDPFALFGPSVESVEESAVGTSRSSPMYLTDTPYKLSCQGKAHRVPWILGVCQDEGLLFHAASILHNPKLTEDMNGNWSQVAPITLLYEETARDPLYVSRKVRKYYFGGEEITRKSLKNLTALYSDRYFFVCSRTSALLHSRVAPTYLYRFSYPGESSILQAFGLPNYGQAHGDDLQYFFPYAKFPFLHLESEAGEFSRRVVKLWKSFAETGNPWATWGDDWCPITEEEAEGRTPVQWYDLNWNATSFPDPYDQRMQFWEHMPLHEYKAERGFA